MRHRLFLALPFPADLLPHITVLRSKININLNWEPDQKLHLTTNFLGNITDEQLPNLQKSISGVIQDVLPFRIHLGFLQTMYRKHEGSFLCLAPDQPSEELLSLQDNLRSMIYHQDIPVADRFWPHLTIARIPKADPVTTKSLLDKIDALDLKTRFFWPINSIVLYESHSDRSGTHYQKMFTFPLSTSP